MKNRSIGARRFAPALSVLSLACGVGASAQTLELNPVVISAAGMSQPLSEVLPSVSVITLQEIEQSQAQSLADLLQGEAGFEFGRNGGPGSTTSFFLRGQESKNLVLMVDGVRAQTDGIGALQITDLPLSQIDRIEVLRGNASALYGESAIGGVIQIFTRQGTGAPKAYGALSAGTHGTVGLSAGYGGSLGDYRFDISVVKNRSDGFSAMNTTQKTRANPDRDGFSSESFAARFEKKVDADLLLGLRASSRRAQMEYDDTTGLTDSHLFKPKNDLLGVFARKAITTDWVTSLDLSRSELSYDDLKNGVAYAAGDLSYKNGHFEGSQNALQWLNQWQVGPGTAISFGADHSEEKFSAIGDYAYDMERTSTGLFAGLTQKFDRFTAQLNVRRDAVKVAHADARSTSDNRTAKNTGLLGLGYQWTPNWRLTASTSTGFRAPTASDVASNSLLKPESHQTHEAGVVFSDADMLVRVVYFATSTHDAIAYDQDSNVLNIGESRNKGFEATVRAQWLGYRIKLSAVSQDPFSVSYNERLARRARQYASLDVSRTFGSYDMGMKAYASGERKDSHYSPGVNLAGYATVALYASRKIDDNWTARLRLENAFDKQYQLAYGYNTPGRGLFATLQYSPK
ncbi:MAG: TonB-dependent receptor [Limnohabitans sp.]|uniref:TonB-dependent receptor domain-containing protein n=1 Tax=Limnohabitans sp. TaxID=1907725 RepID=UPI003BB17B7A